MCNTVFSQLFKKRRNIVLSISFPIEKKCELSKRKEKPSLESVIEILHTLPSLRTSIVPYISLSEKRCSKVIIFHSFVSECFCPSLSETGTR